MTGLKQTQIIKTHKLNLHYLRRKSAWIEIIVKFIAINNIVIESLNIFLKNLCSLTLFSK